MKKRFNGEEAQQTSAVSQVDGSEAATPENTQSPAQFDQNLKPEDFVPTLAEKPESKPIYNNVRQVKTFEYIAGCVDGGKTGCTCYSAQGTPLKEITKTMCKDYARNGLPFNPYKDENKTEIAQQQTNQIENNDGGQVMVMGGKPQQNLMYDGYVEAGQQFAQQGGLVVSASNR